MGVARTVLAAGGGGFFTVGWFFWVYNWGRICISVGLKRKCLLF